MRRLIASGLALGLLAASPLPAAAETFDSKAQQEIRDIVKAYLMEHPEVIIEAVQGLEAKQEAARAEQAKGQIAGLRDKLIRDPRDQVLGDPNGDVTLVEFFDYRCGYCKQAQPILMELIKAEPRLRVVLKEFPILGPDSVLASRAAIASVPQGKYAAFHEALIATRGALSEDKIMEVAKSVGLDTAALKAGMSKPEIATQIDDAHALAEKLAINGTPSFIIGDNLVPGAIDLETLKKLVAEARAACTGTC
ncbi:DsbA family protein [Oleomonas cavernae]|uniref:DsbA family protein n=1 Tax=Oleomonas cavernae TaxID=2320859 RepID=A0A418WAN1_9PROT|nr:DsbA family protein [Oleomonas cavernae]RJF87006.1 DsbA family protein [Oleomonas cavernae]